MKIKIGTDICSISRIADAYKRFGDRFLRRILNEQEILYIKRDAPHVVPRLAGRFAAKEAASKALGTGWHGVDWKEIEITHEFTGEPGIRLHGRAAQVAERKGLQRWEVTVSHEKEFATATVLAYSDKSA
ncbi:MAG TPA: holo-ACP synthase [Candidatus Obscuribacterales bacterium]